MQHDGYYEDLGALEEAEAAQAEAEAAEYEAYCEDQCQHDMQRQREVLYESAKEMLDALMQWQAAEAMSDEVELETARRSRDKVLKTLEV